MKFLPDDMFKVFLKVIKSDMIFTLDDNVGDWDFFQIIAKSSDIWLTSDEQFVAIRTDELDKEYGDLLRIMPLFDDVSGLIDLKNIVSEEPKRHCFISTCWLNDIDKYSLTEEQINELRIMIKLLDDVVKI